jgi:DNA-binding NarL/FixJ family response regulator
LGHAEGYHVKMSTLTETDRSCRNIAVRLVIVEEHTGVRDALVHRLHRRTDAQVLGAVESVERAVQLIATNKPDLVLYEPKCVAKHNPAGFSALLAAGRPVVVWTSSLLADEAETFTRAGAAAVLLKDCDISHLVATLASVRH